MHDPGPSNGMAAWLPRTTAITSTASDAAQPASSSVWPKPEALFTKMSRPLSAAAAVGT